MSLAASRLQDALERLELLVLASCDPPMPHAEHHDRSDYRRLEDEMQSLRDQCACYREIIQQLRHTIGHVSSEISSVLAALPQEARMMSSATSSVIKE